MSALYPNGTNSSFPPTDSNVSSAMIISFEVVFSVAIFGIIMACYFVGIRRRNRLREARSREYDTMVERALTRQQEQPRPFSHHQAADSSSTLNSSYFNHRPPPYSPPTTDDPTCQRLSERDVSRLSQAMLTNHINSSHLPRYNDIIINNENNNNDNNDDQRQLHEHASTTSIQTPPMAITRPFHSSSRPADPLRTDTDPIPPKLPQE